jgi:hypothetical protein
VFGAVQRGGQVRVTVVPDSSGPVLGDALRQFVLPESSIFTDECNSYMTAGKEYTRTTASHTSRTSTCAGTSKRTRSRGSSRP